MSPFEKRFGSPTAVAVAGCEAVTFRAWRNRLGFFPETSIGAKGRRTVNLWSIANICVLRSVVVLTAQGVSASDAIWFADTHITFVIQELLGWQDPADAPPRPMYLRTEQPSTCIGFHVGGEAASTRYSWYLLGDKQTIAEVIGKTTGILTILDLRPIILHVIDQLIALEPEAMLMAHEEMRLILNKLEHPIDSGGKRSAKARARKGRK